MQVQIHRDTPAWQVQVWLSFLVAAFPCGVGLAWLPGETLERAFMVMGYFFCLSAVFVLAKFVRDSEQARRSGQKTDTPMFMGGVGWLLSGDGSHRLGPVADGHQRNLQGFFGGELALPGDLLVHAGQDAAMDRSMGSSAPRTATSSSFVALE